jgi:hypothetical protein
MLLGQCADSAKRDAALDEIVKEVQAETTSLTTVPKPLKFLSKHYARICELYEQINDAAFKVKKSPNNTFAEPIRGTRFHHWHGCLGE